MRWIKVLAASCMAATLAAACASVEPEPCTPEWVQYKKDRILGLFARDHGQEIRTLLDLKDSFDKSKGSGLSDMQRLMRLAPMAPKIGKMVESFVETAAPEVRKAVAQCGGPEKASQLFAQMLKQEGLDDPETLQWIETVGALVEGWDK